jgi:hypothetical protein
MSVDIMENVGPQCRLCVKTAEQAAVIGHSILTRIRRQSRLMSLVKIPLRSCDIVSGSLVANHAVTASQRDNFVSVVTAMRGLNQANH